MDFSYYIFFLWKISSAGKFRFILIVHIKLGTFKNKDSDLKSFCTERTRRNKEKSFNVVYNTFRYSFSFFEPLQ